MPGDCKHGRGNGAWLPLLKANADDVRNRNCCRAGERPADVIEMPLVLSLGFLLRTFRFLFLFPLIDQDDPERSGYTYNKPCRVSILPTGCAGFGAAIPCCGATLCSPSLRFSTLLGNSQRGLPSQGDVSLERPESCNSTACSLALSSFPVQSLLQDFSLCRIVSLRMIISRDFDRLLCSMISQRDLSVSNAASTRFMALRSFLDLRRSAAPNFQFRPDHRRARG